MNENSLVLYTDGSCYTKTKQGGWGWILKKRYANHLEKVAQGAGGAVNTTISRMEMTAILMGLLHCVEQNYNLSISVISDSQFIVNSFNQGWFNRWRQLNFIDRPNNDLWKMFDETLSLIKNIEFIHTRGHDKGTEFHKQGNSEVDKICSYKNFI